MLGKSRFVLTNLTVLMVFIFAAMWTVPAFADDSTPPPVETPVEVTPPPVDEPAEELPAPVSTLLEQLPEGTEVVVTDSAGDAIPLASQDAADAINDNGDPMWCPAGVVPGSATCSPHFTTFNQDNVTPAQTGLIAWLIANPKNVAGVIWVASNYNGSLEIGNSIVLDGSVFDDSDLVFNDTIDNFALTIQGGWSGGANTTITTPSVITKRLSITGWNGNITLKDLVITATAADANTYYALNVDTSKNILLERVTVEDADNTSGGTFHGANLDNTTGLGTVTINNSNFQNNEGDGLVINSAGIITTNNLTANLNGGYGAKIDNGSASLTDKAVTMKGQKQFNSNGLDGLNIFSNGAVTLSNIVANQNGGSGVVVDNSTSLTNLGVTITGSNSFVGNSGDYGLLVLTHGVISAANITASDNGGYGVWLDNCEDDGVDTCLVALAKTVTLSGVNIFNRNQFSGLNISSYGIISVSNVTAKYNGDSGAYLKNSWLNTPINLLATPLESTGAITLMGNNNTFSTNGLYGLEAYSHGNITMANMTANDNVVNDGVHLSADKAVGVANVTITGINNFNNNGNDGLFVSADGRVILSNARAYFNLGDGADLTASGLGMGATLSGTNIFMYNTERGLGIDASGTITASNLTASFNGGYGAWLDSIWLTVLVPHPDSTKMYNVTLTGNNSFNANGDTGLEVHSFGAIAINNLIANENGLNGTVGLGYGAYLDNCIWNVSSCYATTPKAVTLTGLANLDGNSESGLYVTSIGAVTATSVTAEGNGGAGADLNNSYINTKPQTVTLKGSNSFSGNLANGLKIFSYGAIALNNITANFNEDNGVYLDNYRSGSPLGVALTPKTITLTGVNSFIGNYHDGLKFDSSGAVVLNRVTADGNTDFGLDAGYAGSGIKGTARTGSITLICGHTFLNEGYGYNLNALLGPIIIKGIYSYNNGILVDINNGIPLTKIQACALP